MIVVLAYNNSQCTHITGGRNFVICMYLHNIAIIYYTQYYNYTKLVFVLQRIFHSLDTYTHTAPYNGNFEMNTE